MSRVDWAARLDPAAPEYHPCRVWIPVASSAAGHAADCAAGHAADCAAARAADQGHRRAPQRLRLHVPPQDAARLPLRVPALLAQVQPHAGDSVTVDVGPAQPHLTGLGLLLAALWRAVGPQGSITLAGASEATLNALRRLQLTPDGVRADVFGAPAPPTCPAAEPARPRPLVSMPRPRVSEEAHTPRALAAA